MGEVEYKAGRRITMCSSTAAALSGTREVVAWQSSACRHGCTHAVTHQNTAAPDEVCTGRGQAFSLHGLIRPVSTVKRVRPPMQ
jgi:hypothetical protein